MDKLKLIAMMLLPAALAGCSGSSGLSLGGGSIPTGGGGGTITGFAILPNAQPLTSATISVHALATGQTVSSTPSLTQTGRFAITGVPLGQDLEVIFRQTLGSTLKVVVPKARLSTSVPSVDIGHVTALTTVVAQSLERETSTNPEETSQIVSDQIGALSSTLTDDDPSEDDQTAEIEDDGLLTAAAKTLIQNTANSELKTLASTPTQTSSTIALGGLIAQINETRRSAIHLNTDQRSHLIANQLAGVTYSADTLAADLQTVGAPATVNSVTTADQARRLQLPAWNNVGIGINPFEALAIATNSAQVNGFELDQSAMDQLLSNLLP